MDGGERTNERSHATSCMIGIRIHAARVRCMGGNELCLHCISLMAHYRTHITAPLTNTYAHKLGKIVVIEEGGSGKPFAAVAFENQVEPQLTSEIWLLD